MANGDNVVAFCPSYWVNSIFSEILMGISVEPVVYPTRSMKKERATYGTLVD